MDFIELYKINKKNIFDPIYECCICMDCLKKVKNGRKR